MYMNENSSDFRFYVRPLVNAGGDLAELVRIRRIAERDAEYECVLGSTRHASVQPMDQLLKLYGKLTLA